MQVRFIKESPERYRLECVRADGSMTAASLEFRSYFRHDLMHFVVERAANLQNSFFGMVKAGKDLTALSPKAIRESAATYTGEIETTELVIAALQSAAKTEVDAEEVCRKLREYMAMLALSEPAYLTPEFCARVVAEYRSLLGRWGQLRGKEWLEFWFS